MNDSPGSLDPFGGPPLSQSEPAHRTSSRRSRARSGRRHRTGGKRRDIQGLRAVAVVAVVVNHLTGHPGGAFVGVDVFFVISGFLITGVLLRSTERTATPVQYFAQFYRRRARRILPAGLLVIAITVAAAHSIVDHTRYLGVLRDGGWAAAFWANWHLIDVKTDYFTASGPISPLQHYWSLAVEEQFYLVWPLVVLMALQLTRHARVTIAARWGVAAAATVASAACLALAFTESSSDPTTAYFSTFTRGWELGLGAILACIVPTFKLSRAAATAMSGLGLVAITVSLFVTEGSHGFPAPGALLPCLGAGLVLVAAGSGSEVRNVVLINPVSGFIGDISYSVYLVHFPIITLLAVEMPAKGGYYYATAVPLTFGTSSLLYALVERPVLERGFLRPWRGGPTRTGASSATSVLAAIAVTVAALGVYALWPGSDRAIDERYNAISKLAEASPSPNPVVPGDSSLSPRELAESREITASLRYRTWPRGLTPSIEDALAGNGTAGCSADPRTLCQPAAGVHRSALVIGDSLAAHLAVSAQIALRDGYRVQSDGLAACPAVPVDLTFARPADEAACLSHRASVLRSVRADRPDLVIVTDDYGDANRMTGRTAAKWSSATVRLLADLKRAGARSVVVVSPSPDATSLANCSSGSQNTPVECASRPFPGWLDILAAEKAAARNGHVAFVNTVRWYCSAAVLCPAVIGTTLARFDNVHTTAAMDAKRAPLLLDALRSAKVVA